MSITRLLHSSMKPVLPVSIVIAPSRTSVARHSGEGPRRESMADCDLHRAPRKVKPDYTQRQFQPRGRSVQLTPREADKLLIYVAADLARRRRSRGLRLNLPEATALITEAMLEGARDGKSVTEVMALARGVLTRTEVMDEVPELLTVVQVEATFPDGTKLVSCHDPIP